MTEQQPSELLGLFQAMGQQIAGLSTTVGAQGVAKAVKPFDGESTNFKDWIKSIDRVLRVVYDQSVMHAVLDQIWSKYSSRYNWTTPEQYNLTAGQALPDPPAIHCAIVIKGDIDYTLLALL